jgi:hypothetical protein
MFRSFLFYHPQRTICHALCRYYNVFRWFAFVEYLLGMWLYVYIICLCVCAWCYCQWKVCLWTHRPSTNKRTSTHTNRWHTHTATYQVNTQRTQISGRHYSNGTKHGIWPSEDGRIKRTETCRGLFVFANMFLTFWCF